MPSFNQNVADAIADLTDIGRHWLPDPGASEIHDEVTKRLPDRTIVHLEPAPYDEHVLVDATDEPLARDAIKKIAEKRQRARKAGHSGPLSK